MTRVSLDRDQVRQAAGAHACATPAEVEYFARFRAVHGSVQSVYISDGEVVVLGAPPKGDDEGTGHNCDAMGCGQEHVLWRGPWAGAAPATVAEAPHVEAVDALSQHPVAILSRYAGHLADCASDTDAEEHDCTCGYVDAWNAVFSRPAPSDAEEVADLAALTPLANLIRRCAHGALKARGVEDAERLAGSIAIRVGMTGGLLDAVRETLADAARPALTPPAGEVGTVEALAVKATLYANGWTPCPNCGREDGAVFIEGVWICADCQSRRPNDVTLDVQRALHDCARTLRALAAQAREAEGLRRELKQARSDYWAMQAVLSEIKCLVPLDESADGPKAGWAGVAERVRCYKRAAEAEVAQRDKLLMIVEGSESRRIAERDVAEQDTRRLDVMERESAIVFPDGYGGWCVRTPRLHVPGDLPCGGHRLREALDSMLVRADAARAAGTGGADA